MVLNLLCDALESVCFPLQSIDTLEYCPGPRRYALLCGTVECILADSPRILVSHQGSTAENRLPSFPE